MIEHKMSSATTSKPAKSHKPRASISELDPVAAQRRRAQTCKAQRAYRQRRKDEIESLSSRVNHLSTTIEDLTQCFLGLTDKILSSPWIQERAEVASDVQAGIKKFIDITQAAEAHIENEQEDAPQDKDAGDTKRSTSMDMSNSSGSISVFDTTSPQFSAQSGELVPAHFNSASFTAGNPWLSGPFINSTLPVLPVSPMENGPLAFARRLFYTCIQCAFDLASRPADFGGVYGLYEKVFRGLNGWENPERVKQILGSSMVTGRDISLNLETNPHGMALSNSDGDQMLSPSAVALFFLNQGFQYDAASDQLMQVKKMPIRQRSLGGSTPGAGQARNIIPSQPCRESVSINATHVIMDLINRAQCLGTTPGFPKDTVPISLLKAMG
ncbi:hypothetical protein BDZ85DRAFT_25419 [Elsinoe ampelina]|uniref:BZIP domain-containing protein n=1 Tax=Elsinoe ampelina TaxID=302913 RepID=A0A6A6G630_9PEZI|nr:hypothetical protein BDZ85DRAFT_25419 [Elsinoe ampelina]